MQEHRETLNAEPVRSAARRKCSSKRVGAIISFAMLSLCGLALWSISKPKVGVRDSQKMLMAPDIAVAQTHLRLSASQRLNTTVRFDPNGAYFVFLGVYELAPTIFHSGVIVCARSGFESTDEDAVAEMLTCRSYTPIPDSDEWWSCWHSNMYTCGSYCCCDGGSTWDNDFNCVSCSSVAYLEINRAFWSSRHVPCKMLEYGQADDSRPCSGSWIHDTTFDSVQANGGQYFTSDYTWKYIYGTSNIDGQTVYDWMCEGAESCPDCIHWSGDEYSIFGPNCNTYTSCTMKCAYGLSGDQPDLGWSSMMSCECVR